MLPTSPDLTIICPSRGRPWVVRDLGKTWIETITARSRLVFVVDIDDPMRDAYFQQNEHDFRILTAPETRRGMNGALNWAFRELYKAGELGFAVGFFGDDHRPRTRGWDERYLEALRDLDIGFVYGNDLFQRENLPTQVAFTTNIGVALGYMAPPSLDHLNIDVVWKDWGLAIDRIRYLDDVVVEHMHPWAGKAKADKGYRAVNSPLVVRHDSAAYNEYHASGTFREDVGKLKMLIENGWTEPW
jgi:hypothetical protein